jgi:hypothetical protein
MDIHTKTSLSPSAPKIQFAIRGERCWKRGQGELMIDDDVISINYRYGFSIGGGTLFLDCSFLLSFIEAN